MVTYRALLLTPDDEVIAEYGIPRIEPVLMVPRMNFPLTRYMGEASSPADIQMEIRAIRFMLQPAESRMYSLLTPNTLIYRQEGWTHDYDTAFV